MRRLHPVAAVLGVAGLVAGAVAAIGAPASAADDELVATATFNCVMSTFPAYSWDSDITLSAVRPAASTTVTVTASMSEMAGVAPVPLNDYAFTNSLDLTLGGEAVTLTGSGTVSAAARETFAMPDLQGSFTSTADDLTAEVTSYDFGITLFALNGTCTPTAGASLGTLVVNEGTVPTITPSVTPTTTASATATPTASTSSTTNAGKPAKGTVDFACALTIGSEFDYPAKISVSGYRENEGDPVSLVATMSDLPGIAPVAIVGPMDFTLDVKVGDSKTTLTSSGDINAQPNDEVPVTDLTGEVDESGDELEVLVSGFTFDFPSGGVGAECEADSVSIGTMKVGTEPVAVDTPVDDGTGGGSDTGTLPKTGGGDSMPVILLWAAAFTLLGVAGLLCVPRTRRQH